MTHLALYPACWLLRFARCNLRLLFQYLYQSCILFENRCLLSSPILNPLILLVNSKSPYLSISVVIAFTSRRFLLCDIAHRGVVNHSCAHGTDCGNVYDGLPAVSCSRIFHTCIFPLCACGCACVSNVQSCNTSAGQPSPPCVVIGGVTTTQEREKRPAGGRLYPPLFQPCAFYHVSIKTTSDKGLQI